LWQVGFGNALDGTIPPSIGNLAQLRQKARRGGRAAPRSSRRGGGKKKKKRKKRKPKALKRIPPP
jgi:hypothetical protein